MRNALRPGHRPRRFGLLLVAAVAIAGAVNLNPPEVQTLIEDALEHAYRQEYDSARATLDRLQADFPANPAGAFFMGALCQLSMFDNGTDSLETIFLDLMKQVERNARSVLDSEANARAYLYIGAARVYKAIYYGWKGKYWSVFQEGVKAPPCLQQALAQDSSLTDACLGLGVSEYFHYVAGRYLAGLGLFGSLRRSVQLIEKAILGGGYFTPTAEYTLAWIMTQEKRFKEADALLTGLLAEYPLNRMFRKQLRDTYYAEQDYAASIAVGQELAREMLQLQPDNIAGQAENNLSLAKSFFGMGDAESARSFCDSIIGHESQQTGAVRLADYVKEARALKRKL